MFDYFDPNAQKPMQLDVFIPCKKEGVEMSQAETCVKNATILISVDINCARASLDMVV